MRTCWIVTGGIFVFVIIPSCFLLGFSFGTLQATEYGLNYNNNLKDIENKTYTRYVVLLK
jgi:hypothetical protein